LYSQPKEVLFPDIGDPVAPAMLFRPLLEAEAFAGGIGLGGGGVSQHPAEVQEVFLGGRAFLQLDSAPFRDEFSGVQGAPSFDGAGV
jgi:hypothetical protein